MACTGFAQWIVFSGFVKAPDTMFDGVPPSAVTSRSRAPDSRSGEAICRQGRVPTYLTDTRI